MSVIALAEKRWMPDWMIRIGIRKMLADRIRIEEGKAAGQKALAKRDFVEMLKQSPVAIETLAANEQHYEVPGEFFRLVLGPNLKYSCGLWNKTPASNADRLAGLEQSEIDMLELTAERADIRDGMRILDLGCGWGSFSLYAAKKYPGAAVVGISNSNSQREWIMQQARDRGLNNLEIRTANVANLQLDESFDRVVSIEMFEHMRNYKELLRRISSWLNPAGKLFVHVFCHKELAYAFNVGEPRDWMARHFFTGGLMPSEDLFENFQDDVHLESTWQVDGTHYGFTCESWLDKMDKNIDAVRAVFEADLDKKAAAIQIQRWRMFFMACAELFAFDNGKQWYVAHYQFAK